MSELFKLLFESGAFDEWNEWIAPLVAILFLVDFVIRTLGRFRSQLQLSSVADKWVAHKKERALERGDSVDDVKVVSMNPHPQLNVLIEDLIDEFHEFRRDVRNELDEALRIHRREIRAELDAEVRLLRTKISEL